MKRSFHFLKSSRGNKSPYFQSAPSSRQVCRQRTCQATTAKRKTNVNIIRKCTQTIAQLAPNSLSEMDEFKVPAATVRPIAVPEKDTVKSQASTAPPKFKNPTDDKIPLKIEAPPVPKCPYIEPKWSAAPKREVKYKFEVLKSGMIVEEIFCLQNKPFWVFGRLPNTDVSMAHPTISRFHAVLQYKPSHDQSAQDDEGDGASSKADDKFGEGWYIYDLGSTHGTFLNKMRIPPKTYIPVRVGHMLTFGGSTRKYLLQGPESDAEPETELTVTELKEKRLKEEEEKRKQEELQQELREKEGISWGMAEDADEETDLTVNPYASTNNEELFLDDPKKTLRGFFEREGFDLDYKVDEMSPGTFICRVELPIDDANGKPIVAEVCHKGKKKECVLQAALEACRILDRHGVLRQSHHEPMKRRAPTNDSDDDDDFLDRTGDIERKKLRKANAGQSNTLTYEDLVKQETELLERMSTIKAKILRYQEESKRTKEKKAAQNEDDLDDFMKNLSHEKEMDKTEIRKLRVEEQRLQAEHQKLQRLIKIAKPTQLPSLKTSEADATKKKPLLPLFGKRNKTRFQLPKKPETEKKPAVKEIPSDEEEMDEDEPEQIAETKPAEQIPSNSESPPELPVEIPPKTPPEKDEELGEVSAKPPSPKPIRGPAFIPPEILQSQKSPEVISDDATQAQDTPMQEEEEKDDNNEESEEKMESEETSEEQAAAAKKRRNRNRIRIKGRENVDIDDKEELEDGEKYSGWVPPQNQTGDGMTTLNEKFGY